MSRTDDKIREIHERLVRIETRLMKYFTHVGFDGQGKLPEFDNGRVIVPSPDCSLRDCIAAIPKSWNKPVEIFVGDEYLTTLD